MNKSNYSLQYALVILS